ncbi:MAG: trypsin-like peptidase domain-containing protein [Candidatus Parcubacteria bacterium]|nr:trypsin-like peptidase domain-containing protein [Burkholderiales bacterium]
MIESLPLAVTRVTTKLGDRTLTNATGFFFERDGDLYVVTNRHVVYDAASNHQPDRIEIELHLDLEKLADTVHFSIPLYRDGKSVWREGVDSAGTVDVVALLLERAALPEKLVCRAFTPMHLVQKLDLVEMGMSVRIVGFPLGIHDLLHKLPVARQAVVASAFGVRFQGQGCFLTDARLHRGTSGAPVVARAQARASGRTALPWMLLGVHSTKLDVANRDATQDESLDLNFAWYADILLTLTQKPAAALRKA